MAKKGGRSRTVRKGTTARPFFAKAGAAPLGSTLAADYERVRRSERQISDWRKFLKKYEPADGLYQDAFHQKRVRAAQYELMRLEYLNGNVKGGDRLLAKLQDLA
jgi:hypothetical protein